MKALLAHRDARLLFLGLSVTMAGDSLMLLVFAVWIKALTGSNGAAGAVILCVAIPHALAPVGGWLVDRVRRRRFLISANCASAVMLLPLVGVREQGDVWIIYLVATLYGISMVATTAALNGLLKELFTEDMLAGANGTLQTIREGLRLCGPLTGAAVFAVCGGAVVALADALTFLAAAAAIALMRQSERPPERVEARWRREMSAGLRHLVADIALRRTMLAGAVAWLAIGLGESVSFALVDHALQRPPEFVGVLASGQGAGCVIGGLISVRIFHRFGELAGTSLGLAAFSVGSGLCILTPLTTVLLGKAISGLGLAISIIGFTTILQRRTPQPLIGRVSTAAETLTSGPQILAIAASAALISIVDYRLLLAVMGTGTLIAATLLWSARQLTTPQPQARSTSQPATQPTH
jgi:MFS family permease